ncbi:MAG TPA: PAS domain S-box protein, partial [Pyrinomonadaceae bacterium]|nr:PAS domain S-box protein [Pyrinomonadaceae bacterium]
NFTHPDDVGKSISETANVFSGNEAIAFENRYRHKDGSYRWFIWNAQPVLEENVIYGAAIDITTRKRAEDKLRESEERLRLATEAADMFSWEVDRASNKLKWSGNAGKVIGCSDEKLTDEVDNGMFFVLPEDRERVNREFERILEEGRNNYVFEFRGNEPEAERKPWAAQGLVVYDANKKPLRVLGVTQNITERKLAEERLRASQELNEAVLNSLTAHIAVLDKHGTITVVNESWRRFARENGGDSMTQVVGIGSNYLAVCDDVEGDEAGDLKFICDGIREVLDGRREFFSREYPCHSPTTKRWFLLTVSPLTHEGGGAVVSHFNITARRQAEENLRESEECYRLMTENAKDYAIIFLDTDARIKTWSSGAQRILGWKEEEVVGHPGHIIFTPEDRENGAPEKELRTAAAKGRAADERWHVRKDGSQFFGSGEMIGLFDEGGELRGFAKIFRDLTERKRMDDALRESEEKFRNLANSISQFAWMADAAGEVFWYNQRWFEYTGTTLEEMRGWDWQKVHHPEEVGRVVKSFRQAIATGEPWEETFPLRSKTGEYRWFLSRARPIRDGRGHVTRWFGTNTDIEELRRARKSAEEASRLKDEFLATVSHELRTPLTAVIGWTHILRAGQLDEAGAARALETVERNARAQNQLIEDLLDISRIITGKLRLDVRPIDPAGFIEAAVEAVHPAAEAKSVRLQKVLDTGAGAISGDADRLQQVVWNLLSNAIKFTPKGGRVQLRVERVNSHIEIIVADTGAGIKPEFLPFVFDRFRQADGSTTRAHGGLGLGLAIVRHLVELHGGTVHADSDGEGKGATFTVKLPLVPVYHRSDQQKAHLHSSASGSLSPAESDERLDGMRLLVVDDEPDTCEMLRAMLTQRGAEVVVARSAEEALVEIQRSRFDLLISDIGMPGADGYELLGRVRGLPADRGGHIPAVALTAYARTEDRLRALRAGYQMHVPKPVESTELIAVLSSLAARWERPENQIREKQ